ncbi:MAG: AAA family ATPase [Oscillospiraceae bacterium]|nr:AAA family ATPase [Oscillospiraceae bacterium]
MGVKEDIIEVQRQVLALNAGMSLVVTGNQTQLARFQRKLLNLTVDDPVVKGLRRHLVFGGDKLSEDGHCYALREQLLKTGAELLMVEESLLSTTLDEMVRTDDVKVEPTEPSEGNGTDAVAIYLPPFYYSEIGAARRLKEINTAPRTVSVNPNSLEERIRNITGMTYDPIQMDAIKMAAQSKILVLTGGPGTGKTTTTLGIITAFQAAGASILLAAPTGRAAKRLSETTGMEAKTIHRLLEFNPPEGYQRNEENPLEGDVLIVDECSMIDIMLITPTSARITPENSWRSWSSQRRKRRTSSVRLSGIMTTKPKLTRPWMKSSRMRT